MDAFCKSAVFASTALFVLVVTASAQPPFRFPPAPAEEIPAEPDIPQALSLDDLQQLAVAHNPTLVQARAETWRAYGRHRQAGRYPNPRIGYVGAEIGQDGKAGQNGFFIQQILVTGGKLRLSRNVAAHQQLQAEQILTAQEFRVANSVRTEFYAILAADRMRKLAADLVQLAEKGKKIVDDRLEQGEGTKLNQLNFLAELVRAKLSLTEAENRYTAAWRRLRSVIGSPDLRERPLSGSLEAEIPNLTWDTALARLLALSPSLSRTRYEAQRARAAIARARAVPIPNITVQAGSQYDSATNTQLANLQIGFPLPLYNKNRGNITTAQAEWISAAREVERQELTLARSLADAFNRYDTRRAQALRFRKTLLPTTLAAKDLSQTLFDKGEIGFIQLLRAQQQYSAAQLEYLELLQQLWQSVVRIDGLLLDDGLARPASALNAR